MKISELGERELIAEIWRLLGEENEDEDVHFVDLNDYYIILGMDTINENYHFKKDWDPKKIGKFIVDINLSDVVSKNGTGLDFMVSMSFPSHTEKEYVLRLAEGIKEECKRFNLKFSGGDLKESDSISITGLVIGRVDKGKEFRRNGAHPGDYVYITGKIGKNEDAIMKMRKNIESGEKVLDIMPRIVELKEMNKYRITSCIDNSDGIYKSLGLISKLSGVCIRIKENVCELDGDDSIRKECYRLGGDYELIFTSPDKIDDFYFLGTVEEGSGVYDLDNTPVTSSGYDHFKG